MTKVRLRLMLLSSGSAVAQNIMDALGDRRDRCVVIGTTSLAAAAYNFRCDTVYLVPPAASGNAYLDRIAALIESEQPDLVIPTRDDDVLALALLRERSAAGHSVLLTGPAGMVRVLNDKMQTARFAARHGLPFVPTAENATEAIELAKRFPLPLIGKPRSGSASRGVVLLRSCAEIERAFQARPDLIAQPYLEPPADIAKLTAPFDAGLPFFFSLPGAGKYSVEIVVDPDGRTSAPFAMHSIEAGGRGVEWRRREDADLLTIGEAYARAVVREGWTGPLNLQLKRTGAGEVVAFEVNGRLNGGTAPRALLGFDEIGEVIRRFLPAADFPVRADSACDLVQLYLSACPIPPDAASALERSATWPAYPP